MTRRVPYDGTREAAHDLNNLLTAIIGAADAVLERSAVDPETRADIAHIREGARRGERLVRRLRGDPAEATAELISVNQTIRETSRLLAHRLGAHITLVLDLTEPDNHVVADPAQLDRVVLNLIVNARHAMPDGGTVALSTARRVLAVAEPCVPDMIPPGDYVSITVADTGTGIAREQISRIFAAGFSSRRDAGGSGIGLASVQEIVRRSSGFLSVVSTVGHGARFEIYLPRVEGVARPGTSGVPPPEVPRAGAAREVLLVEDDMLVRRVAERALHRAGWTVFCAESAEAALELLERSTCDLMISDVAMPGMDGVALARLVRARRPALPVILTSGYQRDAFDTHGGIENVVFLTKPYAQAELLAVVARTTDAGTAATRPEYEPPP